MTTLTGNFDVDLVVNGTNASFPPDGTAHCRYEDVAFTFDTTGTWFRGRESRSRRALSLLIMTSRTTVPSRVRRLCPRVTAPDATGANFDVAQCNGVDVTLTNSSADRVVGLWLGHNVLPNSAAVGFQQRFSQGLVNVGAIQNIDLSPVADIVYSGAIQGTGGTAGAAGIQVPAAGFDFTPFTTAPTGTPLTIDITLDAPGLAGTFNANTGALALPGNYTFTINVAPGAPTAPYDCVSSANTLNLSTANPVGTAPAGGTPFSGFDGSGALSVSWPTLNAAPTPTPPAPATGCDTLNALGTQVVGGMWIARGIGGPVAPPRAP